MASLERVGGGFIFCQKTIDNCNNHIFERRFDPFDANITHLRRFEGDGELRDSHGGVIDEHVETSAIRGDIAHAGVRQRYGMRQFLRRAIVQTEILRHVADVPADRLLIAGNVETKYRNNRPCVASLRLVMG
jgi:hypothetical protein